MKRPAIPLLLGAGAALLAAQIAASQTPRDDAARARVQPPTTKIPRHGCVTSECHSDVKDHRYLHGPVHVNACDSCHQLTDAATHTYRLLRSREEMCVFCHVVDVPENAVLHEPFQTGACLSCHDPHGSLEPAMLKGERYDDLCYTCHRDVTGAHRLVHGPASAGACGACHQPHASSSPKLLVADGREMCLRCHVTTGIEIDTMRITHEPVLGDCEVCHDPHATDTVAILNSEPVQLCIGCHESIANAIDNASTQHAAVTTERSCLNCHAAHASDHGGLLKNEPMALCFECHDQKIELPDGTVLENIKQIISTGTSLHGPVAQRSCVVCHEIHGGGHRRLLTNEYPSDLYYPFAESGYALCFSCHDKQLVLLARTQSVTSFRNGDRNLHYVHVNRDEKGRTCRVCHDAHAANREQHIRDEVPFGPAGWKLPIEYERLPNGGTCAAGCHDAFEYNRVDPVTYPTHEEPGEWKGTDLVPGSRATPPAEKKKSPAP